LIDGKIARLHPFASQRDGVFDAMIGFVCSLKALSRVLMNWMGSWLGNSRSSNLGDRVARLCKQDFHQS